MNFLSTGEKIKRARIYRGITLKELCQKDISISRMSCIENGKVKWSDGWNYISKQKLSEFFVPVDRNYEAT